MSDEFAWVGKRAGYSMVPNQFWTIHNDGSAVVMLGWLWSHEQSFLKRLNISRVATLMGWSRERVTRALSLLAEDGWLKMTTESPELGSRRTIVRLDGDKQRLWISQALASPRCTEPRRFVARSPGNESKESLQHEKTSEKNRENAANLFVSGAGSIPAYVPPIDRRNQKRDNWREYVPTEEDQCQT